MKQPKIAFIGAGSTIFAKNIIGDLLHLDPFKSCDIVLMDIDAQRLQESALVVNKVARALNTQPNISTTQNRRDALKNTDFVVCMFQVGSYDPATIIDFQIPKKFDVNQTIADTLGVGGIMRALRSIPVHLSIAHDMAELCPNATMLNYVNPMAMISWAMAEFAPEIKYVGLCHSVQGTASGLARDLGLKYQDIRYKCAGINHMAFFLNFDLRKKDGSFENLYPKLKELYRLGQVPTFTFPNPRCQNILRYEMLNELDYFVTESSEHFSEYTPWFIKGHRQDLIEKYRIPLDEYPKRCVEQVQDWKKQLQNFSKQDSIYVKPSREYASQIMNSLWTGIPSVIYGNVPNHGLIDNLLQDCCVEVPILVDRNGLQPTRIGNLPAHLSALISTNIAPQQCLIEALKTHNKKHIYHAAMLDPHTGAELSIPEIHQMVDELLKAHKPHGYMPEWLY